MAQPTRSKRGPKQARRQRELTLVILPPSSDAVPADMERLVRILCEAINRYGPIRQDKIDIPTNKKND